MGPVWYRTRMRPFALAVVCVALTPAAFAAAPETAPSPAAAPAPRPIQPSVESRPDTPVTELELLAKVDAMYSSAWNRLVTYTGVLVALLGVAVPLVVTWAQMKHFRVEERRIASELDAQLQEKVSALKTTLTAEANAEAEKLRAELQRERERTTAALRTLRRRARNSVRKTEAGIFHVQGLMAKRQNMYAVAVESLASAAGLQALVRDEGNLARALNLISGCLSKVTKEDFDKGPLGKRLTLTIKRIEKINKNHAYTDRLQALRVAIREAKAREKAAEKEAA